MGDQVVREIVPGDGSSLSNELLVGIIIVDLSKDDLLRKPPINKEEFRVSRDLLTSEKSSKSLVLQLLSETVLPECYYSDGIESEVVEKIRDMMLRSPDHMSRIEAEVIRKVQEFIVRESRHRDDADVVFPDMSIHIILFENSCKYYVTNGLRFAGRSELSYCVFLMCQNHLGVYSRPPSSSRPKKRMKIQSKEEGSCVECSICLQEITRENEATGLPCSHVYHRICITKWLQRSCTCPLCRSKAS